MRLCDSLGGEAIEASGMRPHADARIRAAIAESARSSSAATLGSRNFGSPSVRFSKYLPVTPSSFRANAPVRIRSACFDWE